MSTKKCSVTSCTEAAKEAGLCHACYQGMRYWMQKGVAATMRRAARLRVFQERLDLMRPANVTHLHGRRRKIA